MTEIDEVEQNFRKLGLHVDRNLIQAYYTKINRLRYISNKIDDSIKNKQMLKTEDFVEIPILVEYMVVMTIGLADVLAIILHDAFGLSSSSTNIYFHNISNKLSNSSLQQVLSTKIADKIDKLIQTNEWKHLYALDNYVKHNSFMNYIVDASYERTIENFFQYNIEGISYKNQNYPRITVGEFLNKCDIIGYQLNEIIQMIF